ncbi:MAG: hypothetical protein FWF28_04390 [Micrococcales bacterium]|nr:hypothetical protein [Micrococcales bacterium]
MLTAWLSGHTSWGLHIAGFSTAVIAAVAISVLSFLFSVIIGRRDRRGRH